jgi:hypothetical protein
MSADAIANVVSTYARQLGGSWTFAKLARSGQAPLEQIQVALGHQSIQTTQRYLGSELNLTDAACDRRGIRHRVQVQNTSPTARRARRSAAHPLSRSASGRLRTKSDQTKSQQADALAHGG